MDGGVVLEFDSYSLSTHVEIMTVRCGHICICNLKQTAWGKHCCIPVGSPDDGWWTSDFPISVHHVRKKDGHEGRELVFPLSSWRTRSKERGVDTQGSISVPHPYKSYSGTCPHVGLAVYATYISALFENGIYQILGDTNNLPRWENSLPCPGGRAVPLN
jgi:hypothetical protein